MAMLRFRKYRFFIALAFFIVFLLYRVHENSGWAAETAPIFDPKIKHGADEHKAAAAAGQKATTKSAAAPATTSSAPSAADRLTKAPEVTKAPERPDHKPRPGPEIVTHTKSVSKSKPHIDFPELKSDLEFEGSFGIPDPSPAENIPDRTAGPVFEVYKTDGAPPIHPVNPPATRKAASATTTSSVDHWKKFPENFPVPTESLIRLPTGKPIKIPRVQHNFAKEGAAAKNKRVKRLDAVKAEMQRAWAGYSKYAWMHDELQPVSNKSRDPFCGWAASLVDGLDTLWIMGMKEEFNVAVAALAKIDFTTSRRSEIPVFETTIRYLGGFLGAWDVSGGNATDPAYNMLIKKAVELADILMSVFDTPNRMPVLYYNWRPEFASQPRRAGSGVSVAELGSLAMEFTRLAQVTGDNRYYDAVARITNAFEDLQNRGTKVPGLFPENLDASGCNQTATWERDSKLRQQKEEEEEKAKEEAKKEEELESKEKKKKKVSEPVGYRPAGDVDTSENGDGEDNEEPDLEFKIKPGGNGSPGKAEIKRIGNKAKPGTKSKRGSLGEGPVDDDTEAEEVMSASDSPSAPPSVPTLAPGGRHIPPPSDKDLRARLQGGDWDCVPGGLVPSPYGQSYSLGGSQDSTYEYFPKMWLLLGGLEPKYKTMHLKVIDGARKHLLYRPMVKDSRDILFSSKLSYTLGDTEPKRQYEVTHLTCFLGGMFGLGGRVFGRDEDVAAGRRLADGCVWAYETMRSGIMPEGGSVVACEKADSTSCRWNETRWWQFLDPQWETRDGDVRRWYEDSEKYRDVLTKQDMAQRLVEEAGEANRTAAATKATKTAAKKEGRDDGEVQQQKSEPEPEEKQLKRRVKRVWAAAAKGDSMTTFKEQPKGGRMTAEEVMAKLQATEKDLEETRTTSGREAEMEEEAREAAADQPGTGPPKAKGIKLGQFTLDANTPGWNEPGRPQTHEEFVRERIKREGLAEGWLDIAWPHYILRPEAIESVWYMYRITGETIWQEKGWAMWEAIMKATRTKSGHSAIDDVTLAKPNLKDEMESFWLAETLKYFYLLFAEPDVISLDDFVLNTEAHPFRRPK